MDHASSAERITELEAKEKLLERKLLNIQQFLSNISGGVLLCEGLVEMRVQYMSDGFTQLTGYTMHDIAEQFGGRYALMVLPEDLERTQRSASEQVKKNGRFELEYRIRRSDGRVIWIVDNGSVSTLNGRELVQSALTDITAYKESVEALRISEKRYEIAIGFSGITVFDYDVRTHKVITSPSDFDKFGMPPAMSGGVEDVINTGIVAEGSHDAIRALYHEIDCGAPSSMTKIIAYGRSGEEHVLELHMVNIFDKDGKPVRAVGLRKDITEATLLQKEKRYGDALAATRNLNFEANITRNTILDAKPDWVEQMHLKNHLGSFTELVRFLCRTAIAPEHVRVVKENLAINAITSAFDRGEQLVTFEYLKAIEGGEYLWYEQSLNIIKDPMSNDIIARGYIVNIDERKKREQKAFEERQFYEKMLTDSTTVYEMNITKNLFVSGHEEWESKYGIVEKQNYNLIMRQFADTALHADDREAFGSMYNTTHVLSAYQLGSSTLSLEYRLHNSDRFIWMSSAMHLFEDSKTGDLRAFTYVDNINEKKTRELDLIYKSQHDMLTGFYNKTTAEEKISAFLATSAAKNQVHAFYIIDLDYFKSINDHFGHAFGDAVLSQTASKLRALFRDDDIFGRIGGDEFVILMKNTQNEKFAFDKAQEICERVTENYVRGEDKHTVSVSIGIAFYSYHGSSYNELYRHSDTALYYAKEHGRNRYSVYSPEMRGEATSIRAIDSAGLLETKRFEDNITEYVFRILYESTDRTAAIVSVLELVGKHYDISRAYVFEDSFDGVSTSNTFEWCNVGIGPQMDVLQKLTSDDIGDYKALFNSDGIFYLPDASAMEDQKQREVLMSQDIKSMVHFLIVDNGRAVGFVGFDQCDRIRVPTASELNDYRNISNMLGVFLIELRASRQLRRGYENAMSIVNGLGSYSFVCNADTCEILFMNDAVKSLAPDIKVGDYCYKLLQGSDTPCEGCPMHHQFSENSGKSSGIDRYNSHLGMWLKITANRIDWMNGKNTCLIDCVDISDYKQGEPLPSEEC